MFYTCNGLIVTCGLFYEGYFWMKRISLTQGKFSIVDDRDYIWISKFKWCAVNKKGLFYAERRKLNRLIGKKEVLYMHRVIMGLKRGDGKQVDHINGNGIDNRRENMRACSPIQNRYNSKLRQDNTSRYKGVTWSKCANKWQAKIQINKKTIYLGIHNDAIDAAKAYNDAAIIHFGQYARLNDV